MEISELAPRVKGQERSDSPLEAVIPGEVMATYCWEEALTVYCRINPSHATKITGSRLIDEDSSLHEAAERVLALMAGQHPDLVMKEVGRWIVNEKEGWRLQFRGCLSLIVAVPPYVVMVWLENAGLRGARKIASSLPRPFLDELGKPVVPTLTQMVLTRFGSDEKVIRGFTCGSGVRSYIGDIAVQKLEEAKVAAQFLDDPLAAIREWARGEKLSLEHEAELWHQKNAERYI